VPATGARMGREPSLEITFPETENVVSALHARVWQMDDGTWWLEDLESTNGTWMDGRRLTAAWRVRVEPRMQTPRLDAARPTAAAGCGTCTYRSTDHHDRIATPGIQPRAWTTRHDDRGDIEFAGDVARVHAAGAAEGDERKPARVVPALH